MSDHLTYARKAWQRAGEFPTNKEEVYPEHGVVQEFDTHTNKDVLEYGCGAGSDALSYLKRGNRVTVCDIVPENVAQAKKNIQMFNLQSKANFIPLQVSHPLPFEDATFQLVNSHGVIHHIPTGPEVVKEFYRVLKPGGLCYIMLYTDYLWDRFEEKVEGLMRQRGITKEEAFCWCTDGVDSPYAIPYTEDEGIAMMGLTGFKLLKSTLWLNDHFCTYKGVKP